MIVALFGTIVILVLPVPPVLLDLLLAMSIGISLLTLLIVVYVKDPSDFSVFPTLLLAVTLFRLGLNVATTRLILLDGYAGEVIQVFGNFVVRGNYVVGTVVFFILIVINFVVITKGAGRIAEVAARFTLDAMPGKQMSIDAELNAGVIDEVKANERRQKIQREADFYGSMDGASKFVRGDAVAGILITIINVVGGIGIGVFQKNLPLVQALQKYTLLSIGDGLVSQVPALVISVAAGVLITRSSEKENMGIIMGRTLTVYPKAIYACGVMLFVFAFLPGMPFLPFFSLGCVCVGIARLLKKKGYWTSDEFTMAPAGAAAVAGAAAGGAAALPGGAGAAALPEAPAGPQPGSLADLQKMIGTDVFAIELGYTLLGLADTRQHGDLLERITGVRQKFAREMGVIIPPIAIRDNLELENTQYRFLLRGKELARSNLVPNRWLAMNVANSTVTLKGIPTVEPVFNLEAVWIPEEERKTAEINGYTVVDATSVLITHLSETLRDNAAHILEREDVQKLMETVKEKNPTLVNELLPDLASVGLIQRVLQNLLREKLPIKNLTLVLETIADFAGLTKNPDELSEQVRKRLGVYFVQQYEVEPNQIQALTLDPRLEQQLVQRVKRTQVDVSLLMDPDLTGHMLRELEPRLTAMSEKGMEPVVLTTTELRLAFKRFFEPSFPRMVVLAYQELPNEVQVQSVGIITLPPGNGAGEMKGAAAPQLQPAMA